MPSIFKHFSRSKAEDLLLPELEPTAPAMAVSPTRLTKVVVDARTMPGMHSRRYTRVMIPIGPTPMDCAARIKPSGSSLSALSI